MCKRPTRIRKTRMEIFETSRILWEGSFVEFEGVNRASNPCNQEAVLTKTANNMMVRTLSESGHPGSFSNKVFSHDPENQIEPQGCFRNLFLKYTVLIAKKEMWVREGNNAVRNAALAKRRSQFNPQRTQRVWSHSDYVTISSLLYAFTTAGLTPLEE